MRAVVIAVARKGVPEITRECIDLAKAVATLTVDTGEARGIPNCRTRLEEQLPMTMKVWIDQDLCTGDGLCEEIAPDVFTLLDDGLAYVKEGAKVFSDPGGAEGIAVVPAGQEEATIESAEECPGECIFIEPA